MKIGLEKACPGAKEWEQDLLLSGHGLGKSTQERWLKEAKKNKQWVKRIWGGRNIFMG